MVNAARAEFRVVAVAGARRLLVRGRFVPPPSLALPSGVSQATAELVEIEAGGHERDAAELALPPTLLSASRNRVATFILGRACGRAALGARADEWPGIMPGGAAAWPDGWTGSITHWQGCAWAAAAPKSDRLLSLGIDAAPKLGTQELEAVRRKTLSAAEQALTAADAARLSTLIFCAKESIYKCLWPVVRRFVDFTDAECEAVDPSAGELRFRIIRDLGPSIRGGMRIVVRCLVVADVAYCACTLP